MKFLTKLFGDTNAKELKRLQGQLCAIGEREKHFAGLSDDRLRSSTDDLKKRVGGDPEKLDSALVDAFALVREAAKRTLGQRHYDEQLLGGMVLHEGKIAEMRTGEGKTLAATAPLFLHALVGKGAHLVTVNDYLARRDCVWMGKVFHLLGLTVGCIQHDAAFRYDPSVKATEENASAQVTVNMDSLQPVPRAEAYAADIVYGTNNEYGFDYLRDNMAPAADRIVQRARAFAIIDEVDSILIDEARTPLIISAPAEDSGDRYYQLAKIVQQLSAGTQYNVDEKMRTTTLTQEGIARITELLGEDPYATGNFELVHHIDAALKARNNYERDKQYVVKENEVVIVDEFTGRMMPGRRFSEGLHQAIEAKEGVPIQQESKTLATITFQNFFRLYDRISGMTGTAATEEEEFLKIYNLPVVVIPTHKPMAREDLQDKVFRTSKGKMQAIVKDVKNFHEKERPVLIGTISIDANEELSAALKQAGVPHEVLNAKNHAREAEIIAQAGAPGAVTVATNMAGRGVDIILGGSTSAGENAQRVKANGGLMVIGSARHESRRIDNQLRGRAGRQGDPGGSQFYVSMEDELMRIFGSERMQGLMERMGLPEDQPIENKMITRSIETAQKKVEGHNFDLRKHLVNYDDVINRHRTVIYKRRRRILMMTAKDDSLRKEMLGLIESEIEQVVSFHTAKEDETAWDIEEIYEVVDTIFPLPMESRIKLEDVRGTAGDKQQDAHARTAIITYLVKLVQKRYTELEKTVGDEKVMRETERQIMLRTIDNLWMSHLDQMEYLRTGIGLRGYGQRDPLVEYKKEAYTLFTQLIADIQSQIVHTVFNVGAAHQFQAVPPRSGTVEQAPSKTMDATSKQFAFAERASTSGAPARGSSDSTFTSSGSQVARAPKDAEGSKVGRNDQCPCGSGKKYKKCGLINSEDHQKRTGAKG